MPESRTKYYCKHFLPQWCRSNVFSFLHLWISVFRAEPFTCRQKLTARHSRWMQLLKKKFVNKSDECELIWYHSYRLLLSIVEKKNIFPPGEELNMWVINEADSIQVYNPEVWCVRSNLGDVNYFINLLLFFISQFKCACVTRIQEILSLFDFRWISILMYLLKWLICIYKVSVRNKLKDLFAPN